MSDIWCDSHAESLEIPTLVEGSMNMTIMDNMEYSINGDISVDVHHLWIGAN